MRYGKKNKRNDNFLRKKLLKKTNNTNRKSEYLIFGFFFNQIFNLKPLGPMGFPGGSDGKESAIPES